MPNRTTLALMQSPAIQKNERRTFAIISHPDAGKTTLTEKLLLGGGAIHVAGEVKARGARRHAQSDWMDLERKRGISVTSSVMTFEHKGVTFNLLDTPGHADFSEDTYRTLSAVDAAIMVLDGAKGIETQTRKLFEVCRLRDIPIITFINKMDRETRDPFELLEQIEQDLALDVCPMTWPVGVGAQFKGCYDIRRKRFNKFEHDRQSDMSDEQKSQMLEEAELVSEAGKPFSLQSFREGHLTPVYFGIALKNFGVDTLLEALYTLAPAPGTQQSNTRLVEPDEQKVSGFVFKIQANMDKNHRDRIAFVRLCSGVFKRGMKLTNVRTKKNFAVQAPVFFLARERSLAEEGFPGDILGIPNHGTLRIGDTLTEGEDFHYKGVPSFAPEIFRTIRLDDPMRMKHLRKALDDLAEEGVTQLFKPLIGASWLIGVVGKLQLDVMISRIETEYKIQAGFDASIYTAARWVSSADEAELKKFTDRYRGQMALDREGLPVYLAKDNWELNHAQDKWDKIKFAATREQF